MFSTDFDYSWMHSALLQLHSKDSELGHLLKSYSKLLSQYHTDIWWICGVLADIWIFKNRIINDGIGLSKTTDSPSLPCCPLLYLLHTWCFLQYSLGPSYAKHQLPPDTALLVPRGDLKRAVNKAASYGERILWLSN